MQVSRNLEPSCFSLVVFRSTLLTVMDVKPGNYTNFLSNGMITESRKTKSSRHVSSQVFLSPQIFFLNSDVFHFVTGQNHTFRGSSTNAVINVKSKNINKKLRGAQPVNGPFSTNYFAYPELL